MDMRDISRRDLLLQGRATLTGLALLHAPWVAQAFPSRPGEEVIPWLDQPPANPSAGAVENLQPWEDLASWLTPNDKFFQIAHYNKPVIDDKAWALEITGLVKQPLRLTLAALKARPRQEVIFTLECSGNHGFPWFISGIGTAKWAGTPLASLLQEAGVLDHGKEVIFWGSDAGEEEVRQIKMKQNFARSMSLADAMNPNNLLCYEMNGAALPQPHGFPCG
jgi:DMSO/TMAO reductase YedYZ molybdopterin-dependent catalytic subunit